MVKQAEKRYDPKSLEKDVQSFWEKEKIYGKTKKLRSKGEDYYFIDGPPYTSGSIHLGTAWNKILKDFVIRYRRMNNYNVRDQPGFDMHGLPIEVQVEKELGIKNKKEIEDYGVEKFVSKCREFAIKHQKKMTGEFKALGVWMDWHNPYLTITNDYILSAWWTLKKAYDKKLLIQSERVLGWCPRCETALAEAEIEYWDEEDCSIYVKFKIKNKNEYLVIWTTTPWTLPSNIAVAVHPKFDYAKIVMKKNGKEENLIVLDKRVKDVASEGKYDDYYVLEHIKGSELEGIEYVHPLVDEVGYQKNIEHKIVLADYVTDENTGLVHTAPGFGPDDFETGKKYNLPPFCPVDERGIFTEDAGKYAGLSVKDSNKVVLDDLIKKGLLLSESKITHRYGHCWRCKTPVIYRTTKQWFLKVTELKEKMLKENAEVKWFPEWAGSRRMHDWVSNTRDWCISRQRYWGIPIPLWSCDCGETKFVYKKEDLNIEDLHRPWIDRVTFKCKCSKTMKRIPDVLDVWFDSAVCSWAQLNYPQEKEDFKKWWPCKWITEAQDQTRGWFYSQLGAGVIAFDKVPYESVLMHGWALDESGKPMSKSLGNIIDPLKVADKYGVDSLRFYILSSAPWDDLLFSPEGIKNANRSLSILWNVYVFATTYMALDNFIDIGFEKIENDLKPEDKWLLSKLENLKKNVSENIEKYEIHKACREIENFILEDLSRWYIRLIRDRTWVEEKTKDKIAAYKILYESLKNVALLMAPVAPYLSEEIYRNLTGCISVHMGECPKTNEKFIDAELENRMDAVREITESISFARQKAGIKLRWPVKRIIIETEDKNVKDAVKSLEAILMGQTNSKNVEFGKGAVKENLSSSDFSKGTVYVDTEITEEIKSEGFAREIIRRIQNMRKEANLNVEDFIETCVDTNPEITGLLKKQEKFIKNETRSKNIAFGEVEGVLVKEWEIENEKFVIGVKKVV